MADNCDLTGLSYANVSIRPAYTEVMPVDVDTTQRALSAGQGARYALPVLPSPSTSVWTIGLLQELARLGITSTVPHDLISTPSGLAKVGALLTDSGIHDHPLRPLVAVGTSSIGRLREILDCAWVGGVLVESVQPLRPDILRPLKELPNELKGRVVAGNVCTRDGAKMVIDTGVAGVRIGVGPGSICTTRDVVGVGVPQLQAIDEARQACEDCNASIIADGGIRVWGDVAKALAAGATHVMMGRQFAATAEAAGAKECPEPGLAAYSGSLYPSVELSQENAGDFLLPGDWAGLRGRRTEGLDTTIAVSGPARVMLAELRNCLRAACGFVGASSIGELRDKARLQRVSD